MYADAHSLSIFGDVIIIRYRAGLNFLSNAKVDGNVQTFLVILLNTDAPPYSYIK